MERIKIRAVRYQGLNDADRLELARLLVKAGYAVRITTEKDAKGRSTTVLEFWEE
jgi:hypothetical protein